MHKTADMSQDPDYAVYREVKGKEWQWPSVALKPVQQPGFKHRVLYTQSSGMVFMVG